MRRTIAFVLFAFLVAPAVAQADDAADAAEKLRLTGEMNKLASKNAWAGVERSYNALLELRVDLDFDAHYMGAQAARFLGKTWEVYERLDRARELDPTEEIVTSLAAIDAAYGRVHLAGDARRRPTLERAAMPFVPDERKAIEWAQTVVSETGSFDGMLPAGTYTIPGCFEFTVEPGPDWQDVAVPKKCGGEGELIVYAGPIVVLGPGYGITPEPSDPGEDMAHPASISEGGLLGAIGGEVGFSQAFAVAASVGYSGLYGTSSVHSINGWLAGAFRPGDLRVAFGPTWGVVSARGSGVYDGFLVGKLDEDQYQRDQLRYQGYALVGGLQLSAGYGLMDFGKLQGVVELGGAWQTDTARQYLGFGLRVGIVPKVPRFEG